MKQTHTHRVVSGGRRGSIVLAGERKDTRESGEVAAYSLARAVSCTWTVPRSSQGRTGKRENTETVAKLPQPAQPRYHAWGARPRLLRIFIQRLAPEGIIIIHKICIIKYGNYHGRLIGKALNGLYSAEADNDQ